MATEKRGIFERITGARVLGGDNSIDYEDEGPGEVAVDDNDAGQNIDEVMAEQESDSEDNYSDEDAGEDKIEEQEGQLTVDVFQDDTNIIIQSTIAGVIPDDLDVSITNDMVTIRGERRRSFKAEPEDYFYQECYWGTFSRSIILPVEIDADRAEAKIKNGILTIRIPKTTTAMTRKLTVKTS